MNHAEVDSVDVEKRRHPNCLRALCLDETVRFFQADRLLIGAFLCSGTWLLMTWLFG